MRDTNLKQDAGGSFCDLYLMISAFWGCSIAANALPCRGRYRGFESRRPRNRFGIEPPGHQERQERQAEESWRFRFVVEGDRSAPEPVSKTGAPAEGARF